MRHSAFIWLVLVGSAVGGPPADQPAEATKLFTIKIQPILANACAACHSTPDVGAFQLRRSTPGVAALPATTQFNQSAALGQIDKTNPEQSKLLKKAVAAHGGSRTAPIKDVNAPAYRQLEQWVKLVSHDDKGLSQATKAKTVATDPFDPAIFNNMSKPGH